LSDPAHFPLGETLSGGTYRIASNLFGFSVDRVDIATDGTEPGDRYLVSSTERKVAIDKFSDEVAFKVAGVFDLAFVGRLDERGDDTLARMRSARQTAIVERLPPGIPIRHAVTQRLAPGEALALTLEVGAVLRRAADAGVLLTGLRPETIWVERAGDGYVVTGLSDRSERLFRAAKGICYVAAPPFERRYSAPEIITGNSPDERALTFILATLLAEWLTGDHPFPDALTFGDPSSIASGKHSPLDVPPATSALFARAFRVAPRERPSLAEWLASIGDMLSGLCPASGPPTSVTG
jgi:hypothetical protein